MGEAYFFKRGGAGGSVAVSDYAMVCAKLPAGSDCICARGGDRMTAENVPGVASFAVPSDGGWTVTISDGTRGRSELVTISARTEVKTVQMSYPGEPVVSEGGVLLSAQSGMKNGLSVSGNVGMYGSMLREQGTGGFWLGPAVDLTDYATLTVKGYLRVSGGDKSRICLGSTSAKVFSAAGTPDMTAVWMGGINVLYTASLSVASLSGAYFIGSTGVGNNLEITEITLS